MVDTGVLKYKLQIWDDYYLLKICRKYSNSGRDNKSKVLFIKEVAYKMNKVEKALPHIKVLCRCRDERKQTVHCLGAVFLRVTS